MKNEIPASTTTAPTAMKIASAPLRPELVEVEVEMIVGVAVVVVGAGDTGIPGESGLPGDCARTDAGTARSTTRSVVRTAPARRAGNPPRDGPTALTVPTRAAAPSRASEAD